MHIQRRDHIIYLAAVFCFWLATYIYVPVFSLYLESLSFTYGAIGIILGSYGIMQILLRFPLGILSDRLKHLQKGLYVSGFVMAAISGLILVFFDSFLMVLFGRLLSGATAAMWVMATVIYSQYVTKKNAGRAMGAMQLFVVLPQLLSMLIAGILVENLGWLSPFWVGVVVSVIGLILALFIKVAPAEGRGFSFGYYVKETIKLKGLLPISWLAFFAFFLMFVSILGFTPIYAATFGISEQTMVVLMTTFFVPHALAPLFITAYQMEKRTEMTIMFWSFVSAGVMFALVPFATGLISLSLLHAVIGLSLGFILPITLSQIVTLPPLSLKTSAMGFYQSFYAVGIFLGPWTAGRVAEWLSLESVFWFASSVCVIATVVAYAFRKTTSNQAQALRSDSVAKTDRS